MRILDERTGDGYVFRTDLRLRPDPRSTPLAISMPAALTYYESVGQNWERAALIKARPVAGDRVAARHFLAELQPFIWRKNLDFAAIEDIHSIKRQIQAHKGGGRIAVEGHDIKIGRGGIREIEFFAQTQQLIWGGRDARAARLRRPARRCARWPPTGRIDAVACDALIDALPLPAPGRAPAADGRRRADPSPARRRAGIARLAVFLGYPDPDSFVAELCAPPRLRSRGITPSCSRRRRASPAAAIWSSPAPRTIPETLATLARLGFAEPAPVAAMVRGWHHGRIRATRSQRAREILTEFDAGTAARLRRHRRIPITAILRFDQFLSQPAGRRAALLAVPCQSRPVLAGRRHHGRGAAARGAIWRAARRCSMRC